MVTVHSAKADIMAGRSTCAAVVEAALANAADPAGTGSLVFTQRNDTEARRLAQLQDVSGQENVLSGIPVSIKDIFAVCGEVTTSGSAALLGSKPADEDAVIVARLKQAGAVIVGRTNMTEFAFSGVGLNPHFGTPPNPYERTKRLLPGGSSSGAAVSVSDGMAVAAVGSDTGGSIRIPAALCGLTGFKPTQCRIPMEGMFPLSPTLDSVGVIAREVRCCHAVDAVLSRSAAGVLKPAPLKNVVFAVPQNHFLDALEIDVARAFERALSLISQTGGRLLEIDLPVTRAIQSINAKGGFAAAEAYKFHRNLNLDWEQYDPLVKERILLGRDISDEDYAQMLAQRRSIVQEFAQMRGCFDAMLSPTVPIIAPPIASLESSADEYRRVNLLLLRNPSIVNFLDLCAVSLPCHRPGEPPIGLMVTGWHGEDENLLSLALALEDVLQDRAVRPNQGLGDIVA